jgi:hypothetical protein
MTCETVTDDNDDDDMMMTKMECSNYDDSCENVTDRDDDDSNENVDVHHDYDVLFVFCLSY